MAEDIIQQFTSGEYKEGFVTDVEQEFIPKGLNEDIVRMISARKEEPQWLLGRPSQVAGHAAAGLGPSGYAGD